MDDRPDSDHKEILRQALHHLQVALELLDEAEAPAHIGAYVDLALHRLIQEIGNRR